MKLLIKDTTREERKKIVKDAFALSALDLRQPIDIDNHYYEKYIEGEMELKDIESAILASCRKGNV